MPKHFELQDIFEPLEADPSLIYKPMFGGLAVYFNGLMVACLMEDPAQHTYKDKKADYPIWFGMLICTSHEYHESLIEDFPELFPHPVLPKWLYLRMLDDEADFRLSARKIINRIYKLDPRIGIVPKKRKKKTKKKTKKKATKKK